MMVLARLMKKGSLLSLKRQSISKSLEEVDEFDEEDEHFALEPLYHNSGVSAEAQSTPSRGGRTIRFSLESSSVDDHQSTQSTISSFSQKMAKRPTIPDTWWISYYLQKRSDVPPPRIVLRSDKHDYRNPDSHYSDEIVESLRQKLLEDTEELDLQHRLNPFLSKDFLETLQSFGLFPEPEDEEEEDRDIVEGEQPEGAAAAADVAAEGDHAEEKAEDGKAEGMRRRTRSDASNVVRSATPSLRASSDEDLKSKTPNLLTVPVEKRGNSMEDNVHRPAGTMSRRTSIISNAAQHILNSRRRLSQKRVRRWTITAISLRSLHRIAKRIPVKKTPHSL
ncbi:hypothetical protein DAPPUDRAFT_104732 [Daphnia pulex]|uniref:Uncharacterized protein n=1 Tax=Daphnia pulex TaxID=6669 RepID=E9GN65_DAPPU|nr:hypothetical protein DAPPUDRAFT_104732 [Daphnia pulex]|eukprot:EFX79087.1 hypothetical protein DAPPUDRAFT_104732 [Daphnia pulex]